MKKFKFAILFSLLTLLLPAAGTASDASSWQPYFFDGKEFRAGVAVLGPSAYKKEGYLPVIKASDEADREDRLPVGTGGIVIFCYLQQAGGKLQSRVGYAPVPGTAVEIRNDKRLMAIRSDGEGYAVLALPPGEYNVQVRGFCGKMRVEKDKTVFLPIRTGKRMID